MSDPVEQVLEMRRIAREQEQAWRWIEGQIRRLPLMHQDYTGVQWSRVRGRFGLR